MIRAVGHPGVRPVALAAPTRASMYLSAGAGLRRSARRDRRIGTFPRVGRWAPRPVRGAAANGHPKKEARRIVKRMITIMSPKRKPITHGAASSELLYFSEHGTGPPLLLVHGLMVTGEMFEPVIERFAVRHRVIVPDLRGHGRSRGLPPPYTAAQLAADLPRLLDRLGIDRTAVLGYSLGGAIARQLVLDHPERVQRLVLGCTYAFNMATSRERVEGHLAPLLLRGLGPRRFAKLGVPVMAKQLSRERADWLAGLMADQDRKLMVTARKETMAFDSRRRLREIICPTLVIAASADRAVPSHHANMLHDRITGSQLVIINGADHMLLWTQSDEFVRVADEFLGA